MECSGQSGQSGQARGDITAHHRNCTVRRIRFGAATIRLLFPYSPDSARRFLPSSKILQDPPTHASYLSSNALRGSDSHRRRPQSISFFAPSNTPTTTWSSIRCEVLITRPYTSQGIRYVAGGTSSRPSHEMSGWVGEAQVYDDRRCSATCLLTRLLVWSTLPGSDNPSSTASSVSRRAYRGRSSRKAAPLASTSR